MGALLPSANKWWFSLKEQDGLKESWSELWGGSSFWMNRVRTTQTGVSLTTRSGGCSSWMTVLQYGRYKEEGDATPSAEMPPLPPVHDGWRDGPFPPIGKKPVQASWRGDPKIGWGCIPWVISGGTQHLYPLTLGPDDGRSPQGVGPADEEGETLCHHWLRPVPVLGQSTLFDTLPVSYLVTLSGDQQEEQHIHPTTAWVQVYMS